MLSKRIYAFHRLVRAANDQPSDWLVSALKEPGRMSVLSRLACLRILACRLEGTGRDYPARKRLARSMYGV